MVGAPERIPTDCDGLSGYVLGAGTAGQCTVLQVCWSRTNQNFLRRLSESTRYARIARGHTRSIVQHSVVYLLGCRSSGTSGAANNRFRVKVTPRKGARGTAGSHVPSAAQPSAAQPQTAQPAPSTSAAPGSSAPSRAHSGGIGRFGGQAAAQPTSGPSSNSSSSSGANFIELQVRVCAWRCWEGAQS